MHQECILALFGEPRTWTAAEISHRLRRPNLSTVYRNIQRLVSDRVIVETHSHDGEARYEAAGRPHHDHLECRRCASVACVPCPVPKLESHILELIGTCASCK
jgi:Fe2+ or Zn2+ uptake regulation protein